MQHQHVGNIIVIKNGVVDENFAIVALPTDMIAEGKYAGKHLRDSVEAEFYEICRRFDPSLPEDPIEEDGDLPENYPDFDGGYFEHEDITICLSCATTV